MPKGTVSDDEEIKPTIHPSAGDDDSQGSLDGLRDKTRDSSKACTPPTTPKKRPASGQVKKELQSPKSPKSPKLDRPAKVPWTAKEDAILIGILHDLIRTHLWSQIKADGRLVPRTSYGVQYHAKMLLAKGIGGTSGARTGGSGGSGNSGSGKAK